MNKIRFGKTGWDVSPLGFGGAEIGYLKPDRDRAIQMLNLLLDEGVNVIDTAASYQTSEEIIGRGISHRRGEYVLISKCGRASKDLPGEDWSEKVIADSVDRSLKRLKTDRIDVMLLHSCELDVLKKGEAMTALVAAKNAGKIRFAGYSGDNDAAAYAAGLPDVDVIETSVNLADQANIDQILPVAVQHQVGVLAKRPIANAAWKDVNRQPSFYRVYAAAYTERLTKMKIRPNALGIPGPDETAWPELALRFTLSQEGVNTAIIGTTNPDNLRANLHAAQKGPLPPEVVQKIRDAFHRAQGSENWTGQT